MHIMFMAQCYAPEDVSAGVLITELAVDMVRRGHQVTMVTGAPSYPQGKVFPGYRNAVYQVEWLDGVRVIRTWSYISPEKTFWPRILHYGTYSATAFYGGLFAGKADVIMSYTPPLPLGISAWMLSRLWRVPWVLQIEDLYPDAAVAAGVMTNQKAIRFFSAMERFEYKRADHISVISESFVQNLSGKGVPREKMTLIPVWADPDFVRPMPRENAFRQQHGLQGKFTVMYAGNLGFTSCLEDVLAAAEMLKEEPEIRFVLIGEGVKKADFEAYAREKGLANVLFLPYQPREVFAEMLAAADVNVVTINQSSAQSSLPSKVFNAMASARPIVAVAPLESDLSHLVDQGKCGVAVPVGQPARLAEALRALQRQPEVSAEYGQNGRHLLETRFSRARCADMHEEMLLKLCPGKPGSRDTASVSLR